jgi:hypothetical protein
MKYLLLFFLSASAIQVQGKLRAVTTPVSASPFGAPLAFIENKGQVRDQFGHTRTDIQFKLSTAGLNIYVGAGQLHYQFVTASKNNGSQAHGKCTQTDTLYRMDMSLVRANQGATAVAEDMQAWHERYKLSQGSNITARSFSKITYHNIYPHIDWVLYIHNNQLEYDFVVHEGGNVADIKMAYSGATSMGGGSGNPVVANTPLGSITEHAPRSYEAGTGNVITSAAMLNNDIVTFKTGSYNGTLVIDPTLSWATYYGGLLNDYVADVATDDAGNIFATGTTRSVNNIATTGSHQVVQQGNNDAFLAKFSSAGILQWATYYGGNMDDYGTGLACDHSGNVYLAGATESTAGIATAGAHQTTSGGSSDDFLAKFNSAGTLQWATYFGGPGNEGGYRIACDAAGNVLMAGATASATGIAPPVVTNTNPAIVIQHLPYSGKKRGHTAMEKPCKRHFYDHRYGRKTTAAATPE